MEGNLNDAVDHLHRGQPGDYREGVSLVESSAFDVRVLEESMASYRSTVEAGADDVRAAGC